ncbi:MAG: helix-turn-helix domain-containing protein [Lentisphaerae bacterium]|nr:helix-turn-helix domain-containing protein [Lentisphaerota bacterium]
MQQNDSDIPIPADWPENVRSALKSIADLAFRVVTKTRSECVNSRNSRVQLAGTLERTRNELVLGNERTAIKDARMRRIEPRRRPLYLPTERLCILEMRAHCGWSLAQTAREFLVTPDTVASWEKRVDERGQHALLQMPQPVNRFPEFVALAVQRLKVLCPALGKKKIADILARCALHLSTTTVGHMTKGWCPPKIEADAPEESRNSELPVQRIVARYPDHTWHVDLTLVPIGGGFWTVWRPFARLQRWPFWVPLHTCPGLQG